MAYFPTLYLVYDESGYLDYEALPPAPGSGWIPNVRAEVRSCLGGLNVTHRRISHKGTVEYLVQVVVNSYIANIAETWA